MSERVFASSYQHFQSYSRKIHAKWPQQYEDQHHSNLPPDCSRSIILKYTRNLLRPYFSWAHLSTDSRGYPALNSYCNELGYANKLHTGQCCTLPLLGAVNTFSYSVLPLARSYKFLSLPFIYSLMKYLI
jgi:hypothetical protein